MLEFFENKSTQCSHSTDPNRTLPLTFTKESKKNMDQIASNQYLTTLFDDVIHLRGGGGGGGGGMGIFL